MSNTLTILNTPFTVYGTADEPIFLAADVAEMIEYSADKIGQMLENVDDNEKLTDTIYRSGQEREMWFLTEEGLYELLMQSRKPLAKQFKTEIKKVLRMMRRGELRQARTATIRDRNLVIEDARIIFRNFAGAEDKFNRAGDRNFCVLIEHSDADKLLRDGWNVKTLKPRADEEPQPYLEVSVSYKNVAPKIYLVTRNVKTLLTEDTVESLDFAEIRNTDLTISPYAWEVNEKKGVKAYLRTMYVTIEEDEFADKYTSDQDVPF